MNKAELIQWVHDKASMNNSPKTAEEIVDRIAKELSDSVLSVLKKDPHVQDESVTKR